MFITPPLKTTDPLSLKKEFEVYVKRTYGDGTWGQVSSVFETMDVLRLDLDFNKYNVAMANDSATSKDVQ